MLNKVPGLVNKVLSLIKITSPTLQEHECGALTAFSGNSIVIFAEWRLIITTPQRVHIVRYLLRLLSILYEAGYETEWASFVRKNNDSPWTSKDKQVAREFSVLKTIFPTGRSYIFGAVDQDHYFYYIYDDVKRARVNNYSQPALSSAVLKTVEVAPEAAAAKKKAGENASTNNDGDNNSASAKNHGGRSESPAVDLQQAAEQQQAAAAAAAASGLPNDGGRRVVEDNVQFNVKMYNIKALDGSEETLRRLGLAGYALEKNFSASNSPTPGSLASLPPGVPNANNVSITAGGLQATNNTDHAIGMAKSASVTSVTTADLAIKDVPPSFPGSPTQPTTEDPSVAAASIKTANLGDTPLDNSAIDNHPDHASDAREHSEAGGNGRDTPTMSSRNQSELEPIKNNNSNGLFGNAVVATPAPNVSDDSAIRPIKSKNADELAVEVIKQASRFVLPDQYESLRLLRDVKPSHQSTHANAAPRYVATYETTIDDLEDTKTGLINLIGEFAPERFTIIALCDPESQASRALKQKKQIGVEPPLYPEYNLVNRTMNRFAWGYQVLSFSYIKIGVDEIIPHSPNGSSSINNVVSKGKS